jgi:hypothetical protein
MTRKGVIFAAIFALFSAVEARADVFLTDTATIQTATAGATAQPNVDLIAFAVTGEVFFNNTFNKNIADGTLNVVTIGVAPLGTNNAFTLHNGATANNFYNGSQLMAVFALGGTSPPWGGPLRPTTRWEG